jgi:hypothetical protein
MTMTPENFITWLNDHYDVFEPGGGPASDGGPDFVCKRCRKRVSWVTKHAVVRHGDDIEVMPAVNLAMLDAY